MWHQIFQAGACFKGMKVWLQRSICPGTGMARPHVPRGVCFAGSCSHPITDILAHSFPLQNQGSDFFFLVRLFHTSSGSWVLEPKSTLRLLGLCQWP